MPYPYDHFPLEGYPFFVERQWGLYTIWDAVLCAAFFLFWLLLLGSIVAARRSWGQRLLRHHASIARFVPTTHLRRGIVLLLAYFFFATSFGFLYHALFQCDPYNFKINPTSTDVRLVDAIMEHRQGLENLRDAQEIIAITLAGLRNQAGQELLSDLADIAEGDVRSTYVASLSMAIVAPHQLSSPREAKALERFLGIPGYAERIQKAQQSVAKTTPEFLLTVPHWSDFRGLPRYKVYNMKWLIRKWVEPVLSDSPRSLQDLLTEEDNRRLNDYFTRTLHVELPQGERVDLRSAFGQYGQIKVIRIREKTALELGTLKWGRLVDLMYFSFMTISTVGYGDILPNSTSTRAFVIIEVVGGIFMLVVLVNEFLQK